MNVFFAMRTFSDVVIQFDGVPNTWMAALKARFNNDKMFIREYPDVALRTILIETNQPIDALRPFSEYSALLQDACQIRQENPSENYKITGKIAKTIFKISRLEDGQTFALKFTNPKD